MSSCSAILIRTWFEHCYLTSHLLKAFLIYFNFIVQICTVKSLNLLISKRAMSITYYKNCESVISTLKLAIIVKISHMFQGYVV